MFDASLYSPLFFGFFCLWGLIVGLQFYNSKGTLQTQRKESALVGWGVALIIAIWLGMRPNSGIYFGDTANYARSFALFQPADFVIDFKNEWLWESLYYITKSLGQDVHFLFTVVSLFYMATAYAAIRILIPHKPIITLILLCGSLMFYAFGVNGLRNGLACHVTLLAFVLYSKNKEFSPLSLHSWLTAFTTVWVFPWQASSVACLSTNVHTGASLFGDFPLWHHCFWGIV